MSDTIQVKGLRELRAEMRALDAKAPRALRLAGNKAADIVVRAAKPRVPVRTGRAARSVKAASTQSAARVTGGGTSVPYFGWLDFGGRVGRKNSVHRPFLKSGRYIWRAYDDHREEVQDALRDALFKAAEDAGLNPS